MDSIILHNKYSRCDISNLNKQFPINWKKVFEEDDLNKRKEKMLDLWKEICGTELSLVISFLQQNWACGHFFRPLCLYSFYNLED